MSYYRLLHLEHEPFSTSPDPSFFYLSRFHRAALFRTRSAIELKRGLSIVVGDIGTGKTTLGRRLSGIFYDDPRIDFHVILNPLNRDENVFVNNLLQTFHIHAAEKETFFKLEQYLFRKGVEQNRTIVLLIDEAQQLSEDSIELLRALLNYETNEYKLLQVILMGQMELIPKIKAIPNFWDRISLKIRIPPLDEISTREMIEFRIRQAKYHGPKPLFTTEALKLIYQVTLGFPRRITLLCHDSLEYLVMMGLDQVTVDVVKKVKQQELDILSVSF